MGSRRTFLKRFVSLAAGVPMLGGCGLAGRSVRPASPPLGPLVNKGNPLLDLPEDFTYLSVAGTGHRMSDGASMPTFHAALAAFSGSESGVLVLQNHAVPPGVPSRFGPFGFHNHLFDPARHRVYDAGANGQQPAYGAVTWFRYDPQRFRLIESGLALGGLLSPAAGARTPWGTWLCAEGSVQPASERYARDHGFAFELAPPLARAAAGPAEPTAATPIHALGRFRRGGITVDPTTGIVYQTEAEPDGLLYRYVPATPARLAAGGHLQALALPGAAEPDRAPAGASFEARWTDLTGRVDPAGLDLRKAGRARGATPFAGGADLVATPEGVYFAARDGGAAGQLWRYTPSPREGRPGEAERPGRLELVAAPEPGSHFAGLEHLAPSPWGDLLLSGIGPDGAPTLYGVPAGGAPYPLARNVYNQAAFSGATFSPDGQVLFVSLDLAAVTLAVFGPWSALASAA